MTVKGMKLSMKSRKWKYALNSSVVVVGVLAVIILLNVLVSVFVGKFPLKIDLTSKQIYELSDKTYDFLKTYDTPTTIYILASEAEQDDNVRAVLDKYAVASSDIKIKNIDPTQNPTFGKKYVSDSEGLSTHSIIVDSGDRFKVYKNSEMYNIDSQSNSVTSIKVEQKITAALKFVSSSEDFKAYFIKGHGETDLSGARQMLEGENYEVAELNLAVEDIPEDAKMIVVAAPTSDFTTAELAKLDKFFDNAGKAQFFFDSYPTALTNLYSYIKGWGIEVTENYAMEGNNSNILIIGQTPLVISDFAEDELTNGLIADKRMVPYTPYAKIVKPLFEANNGTEVRSVLKTSSNTYSKAATSENLDKTETDELNSYTVAAVATRQGDSPEQDAMIFVSGTTMLLDMDMRICENYNFANYDLYSNVLNFLQGSKDDYSIESKSLISDRLTVPALDSVIILAVILVVIPLGVLISGIVIWARRRHL